MEINVGFLMRWQVFFFRWVLMVWTGVDLNIGFSVKNDAEWWCYHAASSFQSRERDGDAQEGKQYQIKKTL